MKLPWSEQTTPERDAGGGLLSNHLIMIRVILRERIERHRESF